MYGLDGPALLLLPLLWLIASIWPTRLWYALALAVDAVFLVELLGDLGWFLDRNKLWLHLALTVLPAVAVCGWALPRLVRGRAARPPADPWLVIPAKAAALCAVLNLYFAAVPHERLTVGVLAAPIVPAAALLALIVLLHRVARPRGRSARVALGTGMTLVLIVALGFAAATTSTVSGFDPGDVTAARAHAERVPVRTGTVSTEGDDLYFEVRGTGPPLLMIAGGQGDAGFYTTAAALLADKYQVITYDRRGNSRSTRNVTDFNLAQQARDAVAVLRAAGHDSALVFGNSGGAIIALEMITRFPETVTAAIAHEPPMFAVEPDRRYLAMFDTITQIGGEAGMFVFALSVGLPFAAFASIPDDFSARTAGNQAFLVDREMRTFVNYQPDIAALRASKVPIVMAVGATTQATTRYYGRPAALLAEKLDAPLVVFPGHHLSYFDLPTPWTNTLRTTLRSVENVRER